MRFKSSRDHVPLVKEFRRGEIKEICTVDPEVEVVGKANDKSLGLGVAKRRKKEGLLMENLEYLSADIYPTT